MVSDPKSVVARGYDAMAESYLERFGGSVVRDRWIAELIARLPAHARVLDLGCGAGVPVARELVRHGHHVVGIDASVRQIELAQSNVPEANFIHLEMTRAAFAPASFDAVTAFYSITHVPRDEHGLLLQRIALWLKPGGIFLGSLGSGPCAGWRGEWLGAEMFFSHYGADANERLVRDAGFIIECAELVDQDNEVARFLWVIARRGDDGATSARIRKAEIGDQAVIRGALDDCLRELSAFGAVDGAYPFLDDYWKDPTRWPYLIEVGGAPVGFILVNRWSPSGRGTDHAVAEFYIAPRWRRQGHGMNAACSVLRMHPGQWELAVSNRNVNAQAFWLAAIEKAGALSRERIGGADTTILRFVIGAQA